MKRLFRFSIFPVLLFCFFGCSLMPDELKTAERMMETAPDSALFVLRNIQRIQLISPANKALYALLMSQALDKNDIKIESDSLTSVAIKYFDQKEPVRAGYAWFYNSRCARNRGNAEVQALSLLKAQEFAEMTTNHKLQGLIYSDKADMYQEQKEKDSCIVFNKKGFAAFRLANDAYNSTLSAFSIGLVYSQQSKNDSSEKYFLVAERLAKTLNDTVLISSIYKGLGNLSIHQNNYNKALYYYHASPITNVEAFDNNKWYLLGSLFANLNQQDSAKYYMRRIKYSAGIPIEYYKTWLTISQKDGDYHQSLFYAQKIIAAKDSLHKRSLKSSFAGMEKKYHFEHLSVQNKNLIIQNKQRGILVLVSLLAISIGVILFMSWTFRTKKRQLIIEQQLNEQKKALLEKVTENNELLQRQTKMQFVLLQNVEQYRNRSVKGEFNTLGDKKSTNPPVNKMQEEIIIHIDEVYNNISKRLLNTFPELTSREILICCMLLADFDTGMIATVLNVRNDSVTIYRGRLRKKLQLNNTQNLLDYLRTF